jgi:hypothetical protein
MDEASRYLVSRRAAESLGMDRYWQGGLFLDRTGLSGSRIVAPFEFAPAVAVTMVTATRRRRR